jgi:aspartate/methionine/tyrosine aminotransferase
MSQFLTEDSNLTDSERERKLYLSLVQEFGILLTPGDSTRNEHPGYFRCVFTAASDEEFELSLIRFRAFANARR